MGGFIGLIERNCAVSYSHVTIKRLEVLQTGQEAWWILFISYLSVLCWSIKPVSPVFEMLEEVFQRVDSLNWLDSDEKDVCCYNLNISVFEALFEPNGDYC